MKDFVVDDYFEMLPEVIFQEGHCSSIEEAHVIAEGIFEDHHHQQQQQQQQQKQTEADEGRDSHPNQALWQGLAECLEIHLDLSQQQASHLIASLQKSLPENDDSDDEKSSIESPVDMGLNDEYGDDEDEDSMLLVDGECELCDRYIQLTRHHLIPRSTWPRLTTRLQHAADAILLQREEGTQKASLILGDGLEHLIPEISQMLLSNTSSTKKVKSTSYSAAASAPGEESRKKAIIHQILHRTCMVCRPCHSAVHKAHDNMALALHYSTIELLLSDPQITKFCRWASKQKPGKYAVG